jgi:hypothetical protein
MNSTQLLGAIGKQKSAVFPQSAWVMQIRQVSISQENPEPYITFDLV